MNIRTLIDEDFVNYKKASMFIGIGTCNWKCCLEAGIPPGSCQNFELLKTKEKEFSNKDLFDRYVNNSITKAIVIGGLEPFTDFQHMYEFISYFRSHGCDDDIIIYTGYYSDEIDQEKKLMLKKFDNIIIKLGRYKPNSSTVFDELLGISLISDNQYAVKVENL